MDALSLFGLFAVTAMLVTYAMEDLGRGPRCGAGASGGGVLHSQTAS